MNLLDVDAESHTLLNLWFPRCLLGGYGCERCVKRSHVCQMRVPAGMLEFAAAAGAQHSAFACLCLMLVVVDEFACCCCCYCNCSFVVFLVLVLVVVVAVYMDFI